MKYYVFSLIFLSFGYGLERPTPLEVEQLNDQMAPLVAPTIKESSDQKGQMPPPGRLMTPSQPEIAWLGVLGEPISETLKLHLGLEDGLVLRQIASASPAYEAGLRAHDIIKSINGQLISSQEGLKQLIHDMSPGDVVNVLVHRQGEEKKLEVELAGKKPDAIHSRSVSPRNVDFFKQFFDQAHSFFDDSTSPIGINKSFGGMFERLLQNSASDSHYDVDFQSTGSVQMMDNYGSVEIKTVNGEKYVIVKNLDGDIEYEGNWGDPQSRAKVPEEIRNRIENIDFTYQNQSLHLSPKIRGISTK